MPRESSARVLRRVSWGAVLAVVVVAPILNSNFTAFGLRYPFTHDQIELPRAILLQLAAWTALGSWALACWLDGAKVRLHKSLIALVAFLTIASVSTALSPFRFTAFFGDYRHYEGLLMFFAYAALGFVAMQLVNPSRLIWFARLMTATGLLLSVYGLLQAFVKKGDPANWLSGVIPGRAFATWGNPDFFGGYLVFAFAFALAVLIAEEDRVWRGVGLVGSLLSFVAIIATSTRGAWFATILLVAVMGVALARKGYPWKRPALVGSTVLVLGGVVLNFATTTGYYTQGYIVYRIVTAFSSSDSGLAPRFRIWRTAASLIGRNLSLGTGPDTIVLAAQRFLGVPFANDAHNYPLQVASGVGLIGVLALYAFFAWSGIASARQAFSSERGLPKLALTAAWAASAAYLLHLMAGLSMVTSTALLYICIGLLLGSVSEVRFALPVPLALMAAALSVVLLVGASALGGRALAADHAYMQARIARRERGDRLQWAQKAVQLHPYSYTYIVELQLARTNSPR